MIKIERYIEGSRACQHFPYHTRTNIVLNHYYSSPQQQQRAQQQKMNEFVSTRQGKNIPAELQNPFNPFFFQCTNFQYRHGSNRATTFKTQRNHASTNAAPSLHTQQQNK